LVAWQEKTATPEEIVKRGGERVVEYQNITLSLPKEILRRVKHLAISRHPYLVF
jgi:hypothetical protein